MNHDASAMSKQPIRGGDSQRAPSFMPGGATSPSMTSASASTPSASESSASSPGSTGNGPAADILKAIQSGNRRIGPREPRDAKRFHYCVPMTLHIDDTRRAGTRVVRAASSNVSNGGFAFIFDAAISVGSTVRAQFDSLPGKPQIAGIVRSCVYICGTQHRIGVEYQ